MADAPAIERISAASYVIPTDAPEADGTLAWQETTLVLVTAQAGGEQGIGWTYADGASAAVVNGKLAGAVKGRCAFDIPGAAEAMYRAVRNLGRAGIAALAISAVDVALWDLKARLLGQPVTGLLGTARAGVDIYGSGGFTSYDDQQTREQLTGWVERDRIPRVKIKIGESWGTRVARDLARVALARDVIGDGTELYVDANGAYQPGQAIRVGRALDAHGVSWFEEPVSSDNLAGLAAVRAAVGQDVAAGEYCWSPIDAQRMLAAGSVDCLQLDATRCGGFTGFAAGAALADARSLQVSAHCAPNLHVHVCAATPNLRHIEYFHDHQRIERMLFDGALSPEGGQLRPDPGRPGLGLVFRAADAERYRQD
jgi:L-alanine-DL-glutamate epimerase-like enolase superfamily enzyme